MSNKTSASRILLIIVLCFSLSIISACSQNPNASKITLVPEPFWESGIYDLSGLDSGEGLIWSPDGKYLAGLIRDLPLPDCPPSPIFCIFDDKPHSEIFIVDTNNWKRQAVLETDFGKKDIFAISWSPDSQHITYAANTYEPDGHNQLWLIDIEGLSDHLFMNANGRPSWSPDGSKIALASWVEEPGNRYPAIYLIDVSSGQNKMIFKGLDSRMYILSLSWSPNGKILAFSYGIIDSNPIKKPDIFFLDLETHKVTQVTNDEFQYWSVDFSPKGNLIALQRYDPKGIKIDDQYRTILKDLTKNCEIKLPIPFTHLASWSPDGQKLVVSGGRKAYFVNMSELIGKKFNETGSICQ